MKDEEGLEFIDSILMDTDSPGFRALNPNFGGRPGYGMRLEWPRWGWGAYLAWVMMNLAESLGCGISLGDLRAIHEVRLQHRTSPCSRTGALLHGAVVKQAAGTDNVRFCAASREAQIHSAALD